MDFSTCNSCGRHIDAGSSEAGMRMAMVAALILFTALHGVLEQFRVQMLPTYLLVLVLLVMIVVRQKNHRSWIKATLTSIMVLVLSAGSVALTWLLPAFTMPKPTGPYAIGTFQQQLVDESREEAKSPEPGDKREVMINVWYPVDHEAAKGLPLEHYPAELGEAISLVFGIPPQVFSYLDTIPHMWSRVQRYRPPRAVILCCCSLQGFVLPVSKV